MSTIFFKESIQYNDSYWRNWHSLLAHRKQTRDQIRPMRLEYVFGFRISLRQTMIKIRRVMTLAGGICLLTPGTRLSATFGCSSAVEVDPSLHSPMCPSFSLSSSSAFSPPPPPPPKLKSSPPKSSIPGIAFQKQKQKQNKKSKHNKRAWF